MKIGFIGGGKMAYALANGFIAAGLTSGDQITASVHPQDIASAEAFKSLGAHAITTNLPVVERSEVVFVSVKPGLVPVVLREVTTANAAAAGTKLYISIAMGVTIETIEANLPKTARVVRVMPNTPALVRQCAAVLAPGSCATERDVETARRLLESVGTCHEAPESAMDAVTALSGSGPAYVFMMIESLADGGVQAGLPRDLALKLAAQTVAGAGIMVRDTGEHPAQLRDNVTSPAGSTAAATYFLEQSGFRAAVIGAVKAATEKCKEVSGVPK